jgi:hypothetical protein
MAKKKKNDNDIEVIKDEDGDVIIIDDDDEGSTGRGCIFGGLITIIIGICALIAGGIYGYIKQDAVLDHLGLVKKEDAGEVEKVEKKEQVLEDEKVEKKDKSIMDILGDEGTEKPTEETGDETLTKKPVVAPEEIVSDEYIMGLGTTLKPAKAEVLRDRVDFIISSSEVLSPQHRQLVYGKMMYALSDDWIDSDEWSEIMGMIYDYM